MLLLVQEPRIHPPARAVGIKVNRDIFGLIYIYVSTYAGGRFIFLSFRRAPFPPTRCWICRGKLPKQDCMNEYANIISKSNAREKENRKKQIELAEGKKNNDTDENRNSYNQPVRKISKKRNITNCKKTTSLAQNGSEKGKHTRATNRNYKNRILCTLCLRAQRSQQVDCFLSTLQLQQCLPRPLSFPSSSRRRWRGSTDPTTVENARWFLAASLDGWRHLVDVWHSWWIWCLFNHHHNLPLFYIAVYSL